MFCKTLIFGKITRIGNLQFIDDQPTIKLTVVTPCSLVSGAVNSLHQHEIMAFRKAATFVQNCCRVNDMVTVDGENYLHEENGHKQYMVYARHVNLMKVRPIQKGNEVPSNPVIKKNPFPKKVKTHAPTIKYKKRYGNEQ